MELQFHAKFFGHFRSSRQHISLVTSNLRLASTPFDYHLQDWQQTGLKGASAVRTFVGMSEVRDVRVIGRLSDADWTEVQKRLRAALEV